jgi:pimeloyl-ACP methyl ester carboxylesterase
MIGSARQAREAMTRQMTPIVFNTCFGWLHHNGETPGSSLAVVICPGLNRDALDAHYPLRLLADEIAAAGYLALRFDYPGTGDSADVADEGHWAAWLKSVDDAADWLRRSFGIRRLVFCGLRFGALLATLAAEDHADAVGLLLLAPVLRGHSYMRQMTIEAQLQSNVAVTADGALEFQELYLSPQSIAAISRVDLRQVKLPPGLAVGLYPQSDSTLVTACEQAWAKHGACVTLGRFDGMEPMLHHNIQGEGHPSDFFNVIDWLKRCVPLQPRACPAIVLEPGSLAVEPWIETPLHFGLDGRLFGILCRPRHPLGKDVVLITNTGVDPHYGFARLSVDLARRLAAEGVASLRFDFAGLGDSLGQAGRENVVSGIFESDRSPDISAAVDALEQLGLDRFAIGGVCSGAYHALQGALTDERIGALFLINMPLFVWRTGDTIEFVSHKRAPGTYIAKLMDRKVFGRLLHGEIDVRSIIHSQRERLAERLRGLLRSSPAAEAMATLSRRKVETLFVYAPGDVGLDVFEQNFGRGGSKLQRYEHAAVRVVPGLDHNLSTRDMRSVVCGLMIDWMAATAGHRPSRSAERQ